MHESTCTHLPESGCTEEGNWKSRFVCGQLGESRAGREKDEGMERKAWCLFHNLPALLTWFQLLKEKGVSGRSRRNRFQGVFDTWGH